MTLNLEERISTALGRTLSVLTFLILLVFTWFVGNDIIYRANPVSYLDEIIGNDYPRINITAEFFPLAFGLSDQNGYPIKNDSLVEFKLFLNQFLFAENIQNAYEIELEFCSYKHFPKISKKYFDIAHIDSFYCPKNYSGLFLEGSFISSNLTTLNFVATKCDYKTYPDKCGTEEEISKFISDNHINYNIFYIENYISIGKFSTPLNPLIINKWKFFQSNIKKITNFYLHQNYLKTDIAIFSTNYDNLVYGKLIEDPTDWVYYSEVDRQLAMFNIHSSNISQIYFRNYIKLSDILASVGGHIKVSIIFFTLLHKPFMNLEKFNLLLNSIKDEEDILNYIEQKKNFKLISPLNITLNRSLISRKSCKIFIEKEHKSPENNIYKINNMKIGSKQEQTDNKD